jgi:hypothetical protein
MKFTASVGEGSKNYIRLNDKESVQGVLRGDPIDYYKHWTGGKTITCPGGLCDLCKQGQRPSFRFKLNMIVNENGALTAKIFEGGWKVYKALKDLHESGWNLEKTSIRISRSGSSINDTVYSVSPLPNGTITEDAEKKLAAVKLNDLGGQEEDPSFPPTEDPRDEFFL